MGIRARDVIIIAVIAFLSFTAGVYSGARATYHIVVKLAQGFITIDKELIEQAIFQYENNIGSCFPPLNQNATIS